MRRAKLAPGSVPAGSLPAAACHAVPRCFVCDEPIKSHRLSTSLLSGRTQYTHSPLPTKIGGYIGDEFVVVVTPQDALCKHCMALINTMDRLELELRQHRYTLTQHLKTKYKLDGHITKPLPKYEVVDEEEDLDEPEIIEVSDEEWTPNKKQKTDSVKQHRCTLCNASYTNLSLFMAHLSRHKQVIKNKGPTVTVLPSVKTSVPFSNAQNFARAIKFKCGCCSETFVTKESLAMHMQLHTVPQPKAKANSILPSVLCRPIVNQTAPPVHHIKTEPKVQASALFEDIEQLNQQEAPVSVGVCTEEQKGRVCLLALLNNGVCSDLSHRSPVECAGESLSEISPINSATKLNGPSDEPTISITVSIPNVLNGGQLAQQQLSFSTISNHSNATNLPYPMPMENPSVGSTVQHLTSASDEHQKIQNNLKLPSQNFSMDQGSDLQSNCLDLPDLCDAAFQDEPKLNNQNAQNAQDIIVKEASDNSISTVWSNGNAVENLTENVINTPVVPTGTQTQSMDMPSLLDEDFLRSDEQGQDAFIQLSGKCQADSGEGNAPNLQNGNPSEVNLVTKQSEGLQEHQKDTVDGDSASLSSSDSNTSDTVKNIAIVSVTSVPVNRDNFNSENTTNDWFYSNASKELSSVLEDKKVIDKETSLQGPWLHDDDISMAGKENVE